MQTKMIALVLATAAVGCDLGKARESDGRKGPAPQMVWHYPADNAKAATNGTIRMQFDRFLAPDTPSRQGFCVSSSVNPDDCLTAGAGPGAVTLTVEYDPVDRVVVLKPPQPRGFEVGHYKVRVLAPKNETDTTGIRAFDGVPLAKEDSFEFTVDASITADEPNRAVDYCGAEMGCLKPTDTAPVPVQSSAEVYLHQGCGSDTTCHQVSDENHNYRVGTALILDDGPDAGGTRAAIERITVNRLVAPLTATDPDPGVARTSGQDSFARNMPYIDPRNPGNSFILYKMIIGTVHCPAGKTDDAVETTECNTDGTYRSGRFTKDSYGADGGACTDTIVHHKDDRILGYPAWVPEDQWQSPTAGEYARLRYRIRGNPMPSPGGAAAPQEIHLVSAWIAAGAPVADCPPVP